MDWKTVYNQRKCTAAEAVRHIKSGDTVILGHCASEPTALVDAMVANAEAYQNVTIQHLLSVSKGPYAAESMKEHFRFEGFFCGAATRKCVEEGYGDIIPVYFSEVPVFIRKGIFPLDVCMVLVSQPDEDGYCYIACEAGLTYQAVKSAKTVIAQVTSTAPQVFGDTKIHVSEMDVIVEEDSSLPVTREPQIGELQKKIGAYCAELIEDGSTIQAGYGEIPNAVMTALKDKKHLGIHTELLSDGILDLYESGVADNSRKSIDQGKIVATVALGSQRLYDFIHRNPVVELRTADYTNNPYTIAKNHKMVCINAALQVDFYGQAVSDSIGKRQFSGVGGQVDFVRGAALAEDGKAIITLPSTAKLKDGSVVSRIVPFLDEGAAVTLNRCDIDYIVTEYGVAHLKGQPLQRRGRDMIRIAHPDFREDLERAYYERFHVMP